VTTSTWDKRRAVLHRAIEFARASGWIETNPLTGRRHLARHTGPQIVDPRVVVNPAQARQLLAAVTYVQGRRRRDRNRGARLHAFFACLYYGGLRPGEAQNLRTTDLDLPLHGWGRLLLAGSRTEVSASYYAPPGAWHQDRPLKRRSAEDVRPVPIPPDLVEILRRHIVEFPPAPDGRLFVATESGGSIPWSVYSRIWADARTIGLTPAQAASPLARRPYDLRHAALSSWLAAGFRPPKSPRARATRSRCCSLSTPSASPTSRTPITTGSPVSSTHDPDRCPQWIQALMIVPYLSRGHRRTTRYRPAPSQTTRPRRPREPAGHGAVPAGQ
jgi:integrase